MSLDTLRVETPRLILRVPRAEDLDAYAAMMVDEESARFIGGVAPREVTWRMLMTMIGAWHAYGFAMFSVIEKDTGRWVDALGRGMPEGWPGPRGRLGESFASVGGKAMPPRVLRPPPTGPSTTSDGPR